MMTDSLLSLPPLISIQPDPIPFPPHTSYPTLAVLAKIGWLDDPTREIPIYINGMPDAGSILCMHDSYASTARSAANLTKALRGTDGPFANPQGRRVVGMKECLEGRRDEL